MASLVGVGENLHLIHRVSGDLKSRGYQVTPATQYGFDFAIYEGEPGKSHGTHLVHIVRENDYTSILETVRAGRVAHTVNKKILLAVPTKDSVKYLEIGWWNERIG